MSDTTMRHVPHSTDYSFKEWELGFGAFDPLVADSMAEAVRNTFKEFPPQADLPYLWAPTDDGIGGDAVSSPGTIYVTLRGLSSSCDDGPTFSIAFDALLDDFICAQTEGGNPDGPVGTDCRPQVEAMRDYLQSQVDRVSSVLARGSSERIEA